jgi:hypothetical protein
MFFHGVKVVTLNKVHVTLSKVHTTLDKVHATLSKVHTRIWPPKIQCGSIPP